MNKDVVPVRRCSSRPGTARFSGRCEQVHCPGEAVTICPVTNIVYSRALCRLIDRLALWQEHTMDNASHIEERMSRYFSDKTYIYIKKKE